jgi:hypothetical protein
LLALLYPNPIIKIWFFSFLFGFLALFWAVPLAGQYRVYYFSFIPCFLLTALLTLTGEIRWGHVLTRGLPLFVFFFFLSLSYFWAEDPGETLWWVSVDGLFPVIFLISYSLALNLNLNQLSLVCAGAPYIVGGLMLWAIIEYGAIREITELGSFSNMLAAYMAMGLPLIIWRNRVTGGGINKILIALSLAFVAILQSRAAYGVAFVALVLAGEMEVRKRNAFKATLKILLGAGLVLGVLFAFEWTRDNILQFADRFLEKTSFSYLDAEDDLRRSGEERTDFERRLVWLTAHRSFSDNPFVGIGYMNIGSRFEGNYGWYASSHGLVTTLLGETGLLGTILFLWVIFAFFTRIAAAIRLSEDAKEVKFYKACRSAMVCLLIWGLFHQIQQTQLFYVILAWGYAANDRIKILKGSRKPIPWNELGFQTLIRKNQPDRVLS